MLIKASGCSFWRCNDKSVYGWKSEKMSGKQKINFPIRPVFSVLTERGDKNVILLFFIVSDG